MRMGEEVEWNYIVGMFKQKGRCFNVDVRSRDRRKRKDIDNTLRLRWIWKKVKTVYLFYYGT